MDDEVVKSGMCIGNLSSNDPACKICLIKLQCIREAKKLEKFGEVIHPSQLQEVGSGSTLDPMDLFLTKMTDAFGAPAMAQKQTKSGRTMVLYIFNRDDVPVVTVVHIEGSREVRLKVLGHGDKDMPARSTSDDYLAEAEIILNHLIK